MPFLQGLRRQRQGLNSISLIDELAKSAERSNSEIVYISIDTEEGAQLLHGFGGLAALCRYPMM